MDAILARTDEAPEYWEDEDGNDIRLLRAERLRNGRVDRQIENYEYGK
jgi:hypothetical protein